MQDNELKYWVAFSRIKGIGRVRFARMEAHFGNLSDAWQASSAELKAAGLDASALRAIAANRERVDPDAEITEVRRLDIGVFTYHDDGYPARLKEIYDYPPLVYIKGSLLPEDEWCLAVVGMRKPSAYGRQVAGELARDLAANRITVVSGLARGIDTAAHHGALAGGGRTLAVMASGSDYIYPGENTALAGQIVSSGALISEYPPGTRPRPDYFPRRNRILSGLSLGVLVVEADEGSGALITARHALEQDREVLAVPGSILAVGSRGTNRLIQEGAKLVGNVGDILEELNLSQVAQRQEAPELPAATEDESRLLSRLGAEPVHVDELCRLSGLPVAQVSALLAMLELKGLVKPIGAMSYVLESRLRPAPATH